MNNKILILALVVFIAVAVTACSLIQSERVKLELTPYVNVELPVIQYRLVIRYSAFATENEFSEVIAFLRGYDPNLRYLHQEIAPPIDIVFLETTTTDFCLTVERVLEAKTFVQKVTCQEWKELPPVENPEQPVGPRSRE